MINADFTQYPIINPERLGLKADPSLKQVLTLPDLNGHSVMLLWTLMTAGAVALEERHYQAFRTLCEAIDATHEAASVLAPTSKPNRLMCKIDEVKLTPWTPDQQAELDKILSHLTVPKIATVFRLIGDELAERHDSDVIRTALLYRLECQGLSFRIMASNHLHSVVMHFLATPTECADVNDLAMNDGQGVSLMHLLKSIAVGTVNERAVREKIAAIYGKRLLLIDYTALDEKTMYLYAHAPFDLQSVIDVAQVLNVAIPERINTSAEVATFIDSINIAFNEIYVAVYFQATSKNALEDTLAENAGFVGNPLGNLLNLRDYGQVSRPVPACFSTALSFTLVNGHTDLKTTLKEIPGYSRVILNAKARQPNHAFQFPVQGLTLPSHVQKTQVLSLAAKLATKEVTNADCSSGDSRASTPTHAQINN